MRREALTWNDIDQIIDHLIPQFEIEFDAMMIITRGGVVPGGLLAEALDIVTILTAAVDFPSELEMERNKTRSRLFALPKFLQFPVDDLLKDRRVLILSLIHI